MNAAAFQAGEMYRTACRNKKSGGRKVNFEFFNIGMQSAALKCVFARLCESCMSCNEMSPLAIEKTCSACLMSGLPAQKVLLV